MIPMDMLQATNSLQSYPEESIDAFGGRIWSAALVVMSSSS